ncbi:YjbF family lipoprotein [Ruegeria sp. HKCCA6707]|uniref:YjbF family lipoprotein n=1 Tax=unclassified Ruegeria TaxID=2625375 RepID=UPI001488078F
MIRLIGLLALMGCAAQPVDPRDVLSRTQLDALGRPTLLAELPELKVAATLEPSAQNTGVRTWSSGDQASLSFQSGLLVASRGLGRDLMTADISGTLSMLRGDQTGYYLKLHSYLDGEFQTEFQSFQCQRTGNTPERITIFDRTHDTVRIEETCITPGLTVTNLYWLGPDGFIWKSRQWVSASAGYLWAEHLVR